MFPLDDTECVFGTNSLMSVFDRVVRLFVRLSRRLILTICANHVFRFVNDHK